MQKEKCDFFFIIILTFLKGYELKVYRILHTFIFQKSFVIDVPYIYIYLKCIPNL